MSCPERKDGALIKEAFHEKGKSTAFRIAIVIPIAGQSYSDKDNAPQIK